MSLDGPYDENNVFARILRGELPKAAICQDEETLAFMDAFPQTRGHCLVIPRRSRARNLLEADDATLAVLFAQVRRVARAVRAALAPDGLVVSQFNGAAAGQTVFHLHVHILPRWPGAPPGPHATTPAHPAELADLARRIAAKLD